MRTLWQDVRYGVRMLGRSPGLTVTVVLCLGLGIGATTTIFSVVNGALLRPFPYEKPEELALVWEQSSDEFLADLYTISCPNLLDYKNSSRAFQDMAVINSAIYSIRYGDLFERVFAFKVTANLFDVLGVQPALGRRFTPEEEKGNQPVAILMDACWRNWFHADPNVLGKSVVLRTYARGDLSFTIIGVMPPQFVQPIDPTRFKIDLLIPIEYTESGPQRDSRSYHAIARLREGGTFREAQTEVDIVGRRLVLDHPKENTGWQLMTKPLRSLYRGEGTRVLYLLLGASALLLVVACGNVADLLLIRGLHRQREVAVRVTLGAGRLRMLRQLAVEGLLLAVLGLLAGMVISVWGLALVRPLVLKSVPVVGGIKVDAAALAFAGAVALATGGVFSLIPALQAWRTDLSTAFRGDATHATTGRQTRQVHSLLAASQIALAFILVVGAGLAVRTFTNLLHIDPGYDPHHVLAVDLEFPMANYALKDPQRVEAFREEFLTRVRRLPGVVAVATSGALPLRNFGHRDIYDVEGDRAAPAQGYDLYDCRVSVDYFRTLGIPVLMGSDFREADPRDYSNRPVVMVNRVLAQRLWPGQNAVGQRLKCRRDNNAYEVIGVVENQCYRPEQVTGKQELVPTIYFNRPTIRIVTIRTQGDPLALAPVVKAMVRQLDDQVLVSRVGPMEDDLRALFRVQQATMLLVGVFAVFAFTLSVVGLYGVMAYSTRSRFKEIAIRIATGARPADILRMILRQGATVVAVGMGVGLAGVFALARVAAGYVYGVAPMDGLTLAGAVLLLGIASGVACCLPARRAAKIDPMAALRYE